MGDTGHIEPCVPPGTRGSPAHFSAPSWRSPPCPRGCHRVQAVYMHHSLVLPPLPGSAQIFQSSEASKDSNGGVMLLDGYLIL